MDSKAESANGNITTIDAAYQNGGSQKARGADFGVQYQIQKRLGTFTSLTQASYLDSFQFAGVPGETEIELRSSGRTPDEGYVKWRANSQLDWAWHGFDVNMTAHYLDGFHELLNRGPQFPNGIKEHYIKQTWFFDVQASYNFTFALPVESKPVAGYSKSAAEVTKDGAPIDNASAQTADHGSSMCKRFLNGTSITLGCNNVFGHDPPDASSTANYADFMYDSTGRFVYISLTKKF